MPTAFLQQLVRCICLLVPEDELADMCEAIALRIIASPTRPSLSASSHHPRSDRSPRHHTTDEAIALRLIAPLAPKQAMTDGAFATMIATHAGRASKKRRFLEIS